MCKPTESNPLANVSFQSIINEPACSFIYRIFIHHNHAHETKLNSSYQGECHLANKTIKFCTASLMSLVTEAISIGSPLKLKYVDFLIFVWFITKQYKHVSIIIKLMFLLLFKIIICYIYNKLYDIVYPNFKICVFYNEDFTHFICPSKNTCSNLHLYQ